MGTRLKNNFDYHTALKKEVGVKNDEIGKSLDFFESGGNVVFCWDLTKGMNEHFLKADAVYSEISWKVGYDVFAERAGKVAGVDEWVDYLVKVREVIDSLGVPAFVTGGKAMEKFFRPCGVHKIKLHDYDSFLFLFNGASVPDSVVDNDDVIDFVVKKYGVVLDFSCGYGNLAKVALLNGKRFVCSDINGKCVYYLAKSLLNYRGE